MLFLILLPIGLALIAAGDAMHARYICTTTEEAASAPVLLSAGGRTLFAAGIVVLMVGVLSLFV